MKVFVLSLYIVDHTWWDESDDHYGTESIDKLSELFTEQLSQYNYHKSQTTPNKKYKIMKNKMTFWKMVLIFHNICMSKGQDCIMIHRMT